MADLLTFSIAALLVALVMGQCRKPRWMLGRLMVSTMNRSHSRLTDWGLGHVTVEPRASILDVGCGGGRTIQKLAATATSGHACGVDYSAASVAAARRLNRDAIATGHVHIVRGSVSHLPFPAEAFDLVTAVETHYYWPNVVEDLREIRRTLKPAGHVVLIAEAYRRDGVASAMMGGVMRVLGGAQLSAQQHRDALSAAGFVDVVIEEDRRNGWIAARGQAPHLR
jgi:SAM-dependent methyltransferase